MVLAVLGLFIPATVVLVATIILALGGKFRGMGFLAGVLVGLWWLSRHLPWHRIIDIGAAGTVAVITGLVVIIATRPRAVRRNIPAAIWARVRWRWLMRNLSLSWQDRHVRDKRRRSAFLPGARHLPSPVTDVGRHRVQHPRVRVRPDAYGIVARVRCIPGSGRKEFEFVAPHIADSWRCHRVSVAQDRPGRLLVRGLKTDPLLVPFGQDQAPPGTYVSPRPVRVYLGRDEWGKDRHSTLGGLTGVTVAGLPGTGKTSFVLSLLMQLAASPAVQFAFIDGKGGGDYSAWHDRAWLHCDDNLGQAVSILEDVHALMRTRLSLAGTLNPRNGWDRGPTEQMPLIVTVIDECHTFFDADAVKGDKTAEPLVRAARALTGQLVRKGRSVLFLTILLTQKQTSDAIPTAIRDNCRLGLSFGVKTRDAAVAGLGEAIRDYPSYCPTSLRDPSFVGCCTATLPSGRDPFVRLRVPEVTEKAAAERAAATAEYRRDPTQDRELVTA